MLVSLFTDGSFCPDTKVGGYGCWAKSTYGKCEAGGPIKRELTGATEAEVRACFAGLLLLEKQEWWRHTERVLVQIDNMHVVKVMHQKSAKIKLLHPKDMTFLTSVLEFEQKHGVIVMAKHVKGHVSQRKGERRHWVNNRADALAKQGLRDARQWYEEQNGGNEVRKSEAGGQ